MCACAVPAADIVTPNYFELESRSPGARRAALRSALSAIDTLRGLGPRVPDRAGHLLVTNDTPADAIDLVACDDAGCHRLRDAQVVGAAHGAGDTIAALFMAHYLRSGSAAEAMSRAAACSASSDTPRTRAAAKWR